MTRRPLVGYPALQYLQSGRVSQCSTERASVVVAVVDLLVTRQAHYERLPLPRDHHGLPRLLRSPRVSSQIRELADVVDLDSVPTPAQLAAIGFETFDEFGAPVP